jgi:hypothetical protein
MLKIKQLHTKVRLDERVCDSLFASLNEKYNLLIYGAKKDYVDKLGLKPDDEFSFIRNNLFPDSIGVVCGDLVFFEPETIIYFKVRESMDSVEIGIIGDPAHRSKFEAFAEDVLSCLKKNVEKNISDWEPVKTVDHSVMALLDEAESIIPTENEIEASRELLKSDMLALIKFISQQDSTFLETLNEKFQLANVEKEISLLEKLNMVSTDYALICNKSGQQILRVPDKNALEDISKKGFKCFICGSSIVDEKLEKSITISEFGKNTLKNDHWVLTHALSALKTIGFSYDDIFVLKDENQDLRILLNLNDEALMIQLTNRKMTLDDAYLINAHISAYKLDYLIVVSIKSLSRLMMEHLREANTQCEVDFVEGLDSLSEKLNRILQDKEKNRISGILKEMNVLTPVFMEKLILHKVTPQGRIEPETGFSNVTPLKERSETVEKRDSTEIKMTVGEVPKEKVHRVNLTKINVREVKATKEDDVETLETELSDSLIDKMLTKNTE